MPSDLAWYEEQVPRPDEALSHQQAWLEHQATAEQLQFFRQHGYLMIPNALSPELLARVNDVADRISAQARANHNLPEHKDVSTLRAVMEDPVMLELLDLPTTFPILWDVLGWNIQLYISQLIVKPPMPGNYKKGDGRSVGLNWHQDGGRPNSEMAWDHAIGDSRKGEGATPMLTAKLSFWLTDTTTPNCGAMRIVPGSHRSDYMPRKGPDGEPEGAIDVAVKPGTAMLFERRLWHSASKNYSNETRKVLMFGYSYRWLRGLDYNVMPPALLAHCDPIRRQLLGDSADIKGYWQPTPEDVPLQQWLEEYRDGQHAVESPLIFKTAGDRATYRNWPDTNTAAYRPIHTGINHTVVPSKL